MRRFESDLRLIRVAVALSVPCGASSSDGCNLGSHTLSCHFSHLFSLFLLSIEVSLALIIEYLLWLGKELGTDSSDLASQQCHNYSDGH